jgi:uncharacterized Ntn-hydrolase superfamily protein
VYSIVAVDPATGRVGAAVADASLAIGVHLPLVRAGIGAAVGPVSDATRMLDRLEHGESPEPLVEAFAGDEHNATRQVALMRADGRFSVFTGSDCEAHAGHAAGDAVTAQGEALAGERIPAVMLDAYRERAGPFEVRLVAALAAAVRVGGDERGEQSAALRVAGTPEVDLRVDDDPAAAASLARLVDVHLAHEWVRKGIAAATSDQRVEAAREAYRLAPSDHRVRAFASLAFARAGTYPEAEAVVAAIVRDGRAKAAAARLRRRADAGLEHADVNFWWLVRRLES